MQTYEIANVNVLLERDATFTNVSLSFRYSVDFDSIVPETDEEAVTYHYAVTRATKFLRGLNNAYILETNYPETELFVTSRINNVSVEVPEGANKIPLIGLMFYHKINAILNNFKLLDFQMDFNINESSSGSLKTTLQYNESTVDQSRLQTILSSYEQQWEEEMKEDVDELDQINDFDIADLIPWWHRDDGQVRDFINIDIESFEEFQKDGAQISILTVDIEDEELDKIMFEDDTDPEPNDDGYLKV